MDASDDEDDQGINNYLLIKEFLYKAKIFQRSFFNVLRVCVPVLILKNNLNLL